MTSAIFLGGLLMLGFLRGAAKARLAAAPMLPLLGLLLAGAVLASTSFALAETQATPVAQTSPSPDFGSPPTGQIPILYNDRHVYSRPDMLKEGRVLAAYVKGSAIYCPFARCSSRWAQRSLTTRPAKRRRYQTRCDDNGNGRQAGGRHQRRIASARRSADGVQRRRAGSGARNLGDHGRLRAMGSGLAGWSSSVTFRRRRRPPRLRRRLPSRRSHRLRRRRRHPIR